MLQIPDDDGLTAAVWNGLLEIAAEIPTHWTLVGAQMVLLHGLEYERMPPRRSVDLDVIVNVRTLAGQPEEFVKVLASLGYELEGVSPEGVGHRFVRDPVKIDVLLPDGIGPRAPREVVPGARSVEVPGGTQALRRTGMVAIKTKTTEGSVPVPSLLGAILVKARAVEVDDLPEAQRQDLAFLLSLVRDPFEMARDLRGGERGWLRRRDELFDPGASAWRVIDNPDDARAGLLILADASG